MKLTITCQICGKILTIIEKDQVSDEDVNLYSQSSSCDTIQGAGVDGYGNPITLYDGQANIQATKTL